MDSYPHRFLLLLFLFLRNEKDIYIEKATLCKRSTKQSNITRKNEERTKKKINYKRGENKGTKGGSQ